MTHARTFRVVFVGASLTLVVGLIDWGGCLAGFEDSTPAAQPDSKIDAGLADATKFYPVFVRFSDQLFGGAGDYEKFCEEHRGERRSNLRRVVVETLKQKNSESRRKIEDLVGELGRDGLVRKAEHFWIVNGFACDATGEACRQLAESDDVSFVYLQRGPIRQHAEQPAAGGLPIEQQKRVYEQVLAEWKDDSDEPFTTDGAEIPWNLRRIGADAAWSGEGATGKGVTVALADSGLMVAPALVRALWKNPGEELNGEDDDGNGYVDDLFGYDFAARSFYCLGDSPQIPHGSICGGIVAGRPINAKSIVTGIAPRSRLMVLRGMGYLKAYEYALEHGADVLSIALPKHFALSPRWTETPATGPDSHGRPKLLELARQR